MLDPFLIDVDEVTNAQFATLLNALAVTARRFVRASELRPDDVEGSAANRLWRGLSLLFNRSEMTLVSALQIWRIRF
ncbi:MAG: hypothetical protein IID55_05770 [Proteobacteria bacterium]|nr:hypothetical protein [Pseudomonadota bacterium]